MENKIKVAVVGVGRFGRHHARVYHELPQAELAGVYDIDPRQSEEVAALYGCRQFTSLEDLCNAASAASVCVPTEQHSNVGQRLLQNGIDVLIEKPMSRTVAEADALISTAEANKRILQIGHLERFNPVVQAARSSVRSPLFFEVHRLSVFSPRSLDVDVVLDVMIHDLDIVLSLVDSEPEEIRGVGLAVLSPKIDIANVRIAFRNGCVANFTASRVSTEQVRKLRWFQPHEYISLDYSRQDGIVITVDHSGPEPMFSFRQLSPAREEPLRLQLLNFLENVQLRRAPEMGGLQGKRALAVAHQILEEIARHSERLQKGNSGFLSQPWLAPA